MLSCFKTSFENNPRCCKFLVFVVFAVIMLILIILCVMSSVFGQFGGERSRLNSLNMKRDTNLDLKLVHVVSKVWLQNLHVISFLLNILQRISIKLTNWIIHFISWYKRVFYNWFFCYTFYVCLFEGVLNLKFSLISICTAISTWGTYTGWYISTWSIR